MSIVQLIASITEADLKIPKAQLNDAQLASIFGGVLGIAGAIAVVFIVLGGLRYSISQGNATDLQKGKDMIIYALVGLVIVIFGFTIVQLVTGELF